MERRMSKTTASFILALSLAAAAITLTPSRAEAIPVGATHYAGAFSGTGTGTSINGLFYDGASTGFTDAPLTGTIDYDATRMTQPLAGGGFTTFVVTQNFTMSATINGRTVTSAGNFTNTPTVYYQPSFQSIVFALPAAAPVEGNFYLQVSANVPFLVDGTTMQEISLNSSQLAPYSGQFDFLPRLNNSDPGGYVTIALNSFELHAVNSTTSVPEPASMAILGVGLVATVWRTRRCL
jgi:hypothetical protein